MVGKFISPFDPHEFQGGQPFFEASNLSVSPPGSQTSLVNELRRANGGVVEVATTVGDEVVDAVAEIAAACWPTYLVRPHGNGPRTFWMSTPIGIYRSPSLATAGAAVLRDPHLAAYFPFPGPEGHGAGTVAELTEYRSLLISDTSGANFDVISVITNIISCSVFRSLLAGERLSLRTLMPNISSVTEELRRLSSRETVHVPALVGFAGLEISDGQSLNVNGGQLRGPRETDRELFLSGTPALTSVFETTIPVRLYDVQQESDDLEALTRGYAKYSPRRLEAERSFSHSIDILRLSLLLSSTGDTKLLPRQVARYVADPLKHGGTSLWDPAFPSVPSGSVKREHHDTIREWHDLISRKHLPSLDIGMRRLLSAATARTDAIDAFVDAVICWESLFGVKTETTFRVTGSIAKILEPNEYAARESLHKELKDLYARRSQLVHGGTEPPASEVARMRDRAIEVAADCLRVLYRDRADLLELPPDQRGARLLLE